MEGMVKREARNEDGVLSDEAVSWLRRRAEKEQQQPFCALLGGDAAAF